MSGAPTPILRMDLTGTAFGVAPSWTDYSSYLATAGEGSPIVINRGRQDAGSEVQASTCTFVLENTDGRWTPGNAAADADWDVGVPVNVRLTYNGVTYDRFTGYVDSIEPAFPGVGWSQVVVSCTDLTARLSIAQPLRSLYDQEVLSDGPRAFYPLTEPTGTSSAGDISGNNGPALTRVSSAFGGSTCNFGTEGALYDRSGVEFDASSLGVNTNIPLTVLRAIHTQGATSTIPSTGGFTLECVFGPVEAPPATSPSTADSFLVAFYAKNASAAVYIKVDEDGLLGAYMQDTAGNGVILGSSATAADGGRHHVALTCSSDYKTGVLWLDGEQVATDTFGIAMSLTNLTHQFIGGLILPTVVGGTAFYQSGFNVKGVVSGVALHSGVLSSTRIAEHAAAALGTGPAEATDDRFTRLAGYAGLAPSGLPSGVATMGGQRLSAVSLIDALRMVARSEGGLVYASPTGALSFQNRTTRYNASVVATLTDADVDPELTVRRDRQDLANEVTVQNHSGAQQLVRDSTSQTQHGRFDAGSYDVTLVSDVDALALAQWVVETRKDPRTRLPSLTVDLITGRSTAFVAAVLDLEISDKFQVTGLPAQAPSSSFTGFVEGYAETIGVDQWSMSFYTSPVTLEDSLLTLDDATKGQLDGSYVLGF